jgi:hypothetical protein
MIQFRRAEKVIQQVKDENIVDQARKTLLNIEEAISILQNQGVYLDYLPYLQASKVEDGSILIEWIFDNLRIGFSIEPTLEESSWYLVSDSKLGEISASGYLSQNEPNTISLILWLLNFVIFHLGIDKGERL